MMLDINAFAYYSTVHSSFIVDKGDFEIMVGSSSNDVKLSGTIKIIEDFNLSKGVEKFSYNDNFQVYPVPASNFLTVTAPSDNSESLVEIYDMNGRKLDSFQLKGKSMDINCSGYKEGIYICRFISGQLVSAKKIVIEK